MLKSVPIRRLPTQASRPATTARAGGKFATLPDLASVQWVGKERMHVCFHARCLCSMMSDAHCEQSWLARKLLTILETDTQRRAWMLLSISAHLKYTSHLLMQFLEQRSQRWLHMFEGGRIDRFRTRRCNSKTIITCTVCKKRVLPRPAPHVSTNLCLFGSRRFQTQTSSSGYFV